MGKKKNKKPANNKVDRVRLGLDGSFGKAKLVSWPQFIPKEAACVKHLVPCF